MHDLIYILYMIFIDYEDFQSQYAFPVSFIQMFVSYLFFFFLFFFFSISLFIVWKY